jgi:cell wall-associated NlpC family hydrolase
VTRGRLPDPRRHAYRPDLAAASLKDLVRAPRYATGETRQIMAPVLPLRREPRFDATLDSEALFGETLEVFEEQEGWAWVQLARDRYVGYMPSEGLAPAAAAPTHRIAALRTYLYPTPDIKRPPLALLSLNALLAVQAAEGRFLALEGGGFVIAEHARKLDEPVADPVAVAAAFLGTPYLWGGRTSIGVDCSGLVQLACEAAGLPAPRDTDMQAAELGTPLDRQGADAVTRGDLVFWDGHVGIMASADALLHASAHHMSVVVEPLAEATARIAATGCEILQIRRLARPGAAPSR